MGCALLLQLDQPAAVKIIVVEAVEVIEILEVVVAEKEQQRQR